MIIRGIEFLCFLAHYLPGQRQIPFLPVLHRGQNP